MKHTHDVVILGAGTAGLAALAEVRKATRDYLVVHEGPYGTTCARVGCMPTKVLVQAANDFHRRTVFARMGIYSAADLVLDSREMLAHVRELRDEFVEATLDTSFSRLGERLVEGRASFVAPDVIRVGKRRLRARRFILATGSRPDLSSIPEGCRDRVRETVVDHLIAVERRPSVESLNLAALGVPLGKNGIPRYDRRTMQVAGLPIFIAGDARGGRPSLHDAEDEGRIAGVNAIAREPVVFRRRTRLGVCFTDPNIAVVGKSFRALRDVSPLVGRATFETQGRCKTMARNEGELRIYAERGTGRLLGAEMIAPYGEHLAHLIAWVIQRRLDAHAVLELPFYHPTVEEALRTALREISRRLSGRGRLSGIELRRARDRGMKVAS